MERRLSKYVYLIFFFVSMILSIMMFWKISEELFDKIILAISAGAFEIGKILLWKKWVERTDFLALAAALVFIAVSVSASVYFTVSITNSQYSEASNLNAITAEYEKELKSIDLDILALQESLKSLPSNYSTAKTKLVTALNDLRVKKSEIILSKQKSFTEKSSNIFKELGIMLGMDPRRIMFIFFAAFAILIEAGAILLAPFHHIEPKKDEDPALEMAKTELDEHDLYAYRKAQQKKASAIMRIGEWLITENGDVNSTVEISARTDETLRMVDSVKKYLVRKGILKTNRNGYALAIPKEELMERLEKIQ